MLQVLGARCLCLFEAYKKQYLHFLPLCLSAALPGHVQHHADEHVAAGPDHRGAGGHRERQAPAVRAQGLLAPHQRVRRLGPREAGVRPGGGAAEDQAAGHTQEARQGRHLALQEVLRGRHQVSQMCGWHVCFKLHCKKYKRLTEIKTHLVRFFKTHLVPILKTHYVRLRY